MWTYLSTPSQEEAQINVQNIQEKNGGHGRWDRIVVTTSRANRSLISPIQIRFVLDYPYFSNLQLLGKLPPPMTLGEVSHRGFGTPSLLGKETGPKD